MKVEQVELDEDRPFCRIELTRREAVCIKMAMGKAVDRGFDAPDFNLFQLLKSLLEKPGN